MLRMQSYKTASNFRYQPQVHIVTCVSDGLAIDKSGVPMTPSLGSINFLEKFIELRNTFYLLYF